MTLSDDERTIRDQLVRLEARLDSLQAASADQATSIEAIGQSLGGGGRDKKLLGQMKRVLAHVARLGGAFDLSTDPRFFAAADPLVESGRTMLGHDRLFTLWQAASNVAPLNHPAVEVGTFRGGSASLLAQALRTFAGAERELHVVDTFEGHLDSTFTEHDPEIHHGKFQGTSYEDVRTFLAVHPAVQVHRGDATVVIPAWPERRYALVHLDVDLYAPTLRCLEYFGPRLVSGGILVMDDYESPTCPGVSQAVHEYLGRAPAFQTWKVQAEQMVLVKMGAD